MLNTTEPLQEHIIHHLNGHPSSFILLSLILHLHIYFLHLEGTEQINNVQSRDNKQRLQTNKQTLTFGTM